MFWIYAVINFAQFVVYIFLGEETLYMQQVDSATANVPRSRLSNRLIPCRINPLALNFTDFLKPILLARFPRVLFPVCAASAAFCYASVGIVRYMRLTIWSIMPLHHKSLLGSIVMRSAERRRSSTREICRA